MFSKKKTECRVCGYRFTPERENIYTAEEPRSALEMLTAAPTRFSAVDCPICGCQIRLADRAPRIDLPAITEHGLTLCADGFRRLIIRKEKDMATPYKECPHCGAHLDSGEKCDCRAAEADGNAEKELKERTKDNDN